MADEQKRPEPSKTFAESIREQAKTDNTGALENAIAATEKARAVQIDDEGRMKTSSLDGL